MDKEEKKERGIIETKIAEKKNPFDLVDPEASLKI